MYERRVDPKPVRFVCASIFYFMEGFISSSNYFDSTFASAFKISATEPFAYSVDNSTNSALIVIDDADLIVVVLSYISTSNNFYDFQIDLPIALMIPINKSGKFDIYASASGGLVSGNAPEFVCTFSLSPSLVDIIYSESDRGITFGGNIFMMNKV